MAAVAGAPAARAADAPAKCQLALVGDMKVDFANDRPTLTGAVNGHPIRALADTGAGLTMISRLTAVRMGLALDDLPGLRLYGAGGATQAQRALLRDFTLGSYTVHNMRMVAAGEQALDVDMMLGQDFWGQADAEFDLAHGAIRLLKPSRACGDADMPYWAKPGQAYSMAPFVGGEDSRKRIVVLVKLNGKTVRAQLDSGAQRSVLTTRAASRLGIAAGEIAGSGRGIGSRRIEQRVIKLDSFSIGEEAINNTRLLTGDLFSGVGFTETGSHIVAGADDAPEMLLGADFMRAHHLIISQARHAVYFTYEGGPVFDVRARPAPPRPAPDAAPAGASPSSSPPTSPAPPGGA